jgi:hypothetical protein
MTTMRIASMLKSLLRRMVKSTPQIRKFTNILRFLTFPSTTITYYLFLVLFLLLFPLRVSVTVL